MPAPVIVFPGQGAQKPGMGESFREHPLYREHLAAADALLGYELSRLIAEGPAPELTRTEIAQPALLTVETGIYRVWRACGGAEPAAVAGHSLGEYSALVAAGALEFAAALKLVQLRAQLMQQACDARPGAMAAVLRPGDLEGLCRAGGVVIANYNSPQQVVLSGEAEALALVCERIRAEKRGRPVMLKVSGAFHSPLMEPARVALAEALAAAPFQDAAMPVVMNVHGKAVTAAAELRGRLQAQITSPVHWNASVLSLAGFGRPFLEFGPSTLTALIQQCLPEAMVQNLAEWQQMQALLAGENDAEASSLAG